MIGLWSTRPPAGDAGDAELVARARAGDAQALDQVFRRYGPPVRDFVQRLVRDRRAAEGLTRDVFAAARGRIGSMTDATLLRPWLFVTAARYACAVLRSRPFPAAPAPDDGPAAAATGPAGEVAAADRLDVLLAALHQRPAGDRWALVSFLDGADGPELARAHHDGPAAGRGRRAGRTAAGGGGCPRLRQLATAWGVAPGPAARGAVVTHVRRCPRCALWGRLDRPEALLPLLVVFHCPADVRREVLTVVAATRTGAPAHRGVTAVGCR